jgi:hypothetical protein
MSTSSGSSSSGGGGGGTAASTNNRLRRSARSSTTQPASVYSVGDVVQVSLQARDRKSLMLCVCSDADPMSGFLLQQKRQCKTGVLTSRSFFVSTHNLVCMSTRFYAAAMTPPFKPSLCDSYYPMKTLWGRLLRRRRQSIRAPPSAAMAVLHCVDG